MERNIQMEGNVVDYQLNIIPIDITVFASVPLTIRGSFIGLMELSI